MILFARYTEFFLRSRQIMYGRGMDAQYVAHTRRGNLYAGLGLTTSLLMSVGKLFMSCGDL